PQTSARPEQLERLSSAVLQLLRQRPLPSESPTPDRGAAPGAESRPPADDAPLEELIEYWSRRSEFGKPADPPHPTEMVRERLLSAAEKRPWILPKLYDFLPETSDAHDRLYKTLTKDPEEFDYVEANNWRPSLYWWLQSNTQYLRDELIDA